MNVKERIQSLMDERHWSMYRLAQEADMSWSTIRNVMKRDTEPGIATLETLCKAFGISLSQFFDTEGANGLTPEQRQLLHDWGCLDRQTQESLKHIIRGLHQKG